MEESTKPKKDLDAKGKQSAKKKLLMQEKNKKIQNTTDKIQYDPHVLSKDQIKELKKIKRTKAAFKYLMPNVKNKQKTKSQT